MDTLWSRRRLIAGIGAATLSPPALAAPIRRLRMLLNSGYSGAQSWFFLAEDRGHFARAGLSIDFTTGLGAYKAAPRMAAEGFDAAFGDLYSMIEVVAAAPRGAGDHLPIAVYVMFNRSPSTIVVDAAGPIRRPADLAGHTLIGHDRDVALETFPAYARASGIDPAQIRAQPRDATMAAMLRAMLGGDVGGVFGYVTTATAHAAASGIGLKRLRFLRFADQLPDFQGHALMVSRRLAATEPATVRRLVRAVNRGLAGTVSDRAAGIAAVARRDPAINAAIERRRLDGTLDGDMGHADTARLGIGAVDPGRLARSIALHAATKGLPRVPAPAEIFTARFLPPQRERVTWLGPAADPGRPT